MNKSCNQKSCIKKCFWVALIISMVFIIGMIAQNYLSHKAESQPLEQSQKQMPAEEFLPLPDAQKKPQESQEPIKLNADSQVKEGW